MFQPQAQSTARASAGLPVRARLAERTSAPTRASSRARGSLRRLVALSMAAVVWRSIR